jgi:glycosyltransferase involved in cell wall biosynthesis
MAILEAGACGAPIVASAVGGVPEAVRQAGGGLLVAPGVDSIAAGVLTMLRRGPLERTEGPAVTWRTTAEHTLRAYREVTA